MNVIPILAEYPTMRVLVQNIQVSASNITSVLRTLKDAVDTFQKDLGTFRKNLTIKRSKMGYELDVRGDHAQSVEESSTNYTSTRTSSKHGRKKSISTKPPIKKPVVERARPKETKDVWGVGKTGSSLSYILRAGLFSLGLLPKDAQPTLMLLTDGVVKSNIQDESVIRQLTSDNITCNVIHMGMEHGFIPGFNFGFVPDIEIIEFLASVTQGHFMYAQHCPRIYDDDMVPSLSPNIYHTRFLLKELSLEPNKPESRLANTKNDGDGQDRMLFPWDPLSRPIREELKLLRFREYTLPPECHHFMRARLRQGFVLHSLNFEETKHSKKAAMDASVPFQKKERITATFLLHWQPDITIEYRIKSAWTTDLQKSIVNTDGHQMENLFRHLQASTAEIVIRSIPSFLQMLHDWDDFQRRNQIMVVQGSKNSNELHGAPGFLKVGKLRRLLEKLVETDAMLKQLSQFNQQVEKINPSFNPIQKFSSFWSKLERSDSRSFNVCWYDEFQFNLIIESSAMNSYSAKDFRVDGAYMGEEYDQVQVALNQIYAKLDYWSHFTSDDHQVHVKLLQMDPAVQPQFCEVRVIKETEHLLCLRMSFFNMNSKDRQHLVKELQDALCVQGASETTALQVRAPALNGLGIENQEDASECVTITRRPLSHLLLRDATHYMSNETVQAKSWHMNPSMILTGEYIVRNYLHQSTWHWDIQDVHSDKLSHRIFTSILNLSFEHISQSKLEDWRLISSNKMFCHFYKEVESNQVICAMQYFIWKDVNKKRITTELWMEPVSTKTHDSFRTALFERDKQIMTQLTTFDIMYAFGQSYHVEALDRNAREVNEDLRGCTKWIHPSGLFQLVSVLRLGTFLFASYPCPSYNRHFHAQNESADTTNVMNTPVITPIIEPQDPGFMRAARRTGSRSRTISKFSPAASPLMIGTPIIWHSDKSSTCTCPRPDELFCREKDAISRLPAVLRDIALLHYYIEQSLSVVADRSMSLSKAISDDFWGSLVREIFACCETGVLSVTPYLRDFRCFVKIFDPSVFVVILLPRLDTIVKGLGLLEPEHHIQLQLNKIGLLMFECHRQMPGFYQGSPLAEQIKVKPIDPTTSKEWLDSLGSTLRPRLWRGYFPNAFINEPLSDRTLRLMQDVTQVYSRSFVKSIFTCLLHGRAVNSEDFEKVLDICDESNLDIDLTGYLNVQTLLKRRGRTSEEELVSANTRFISVLGHYFEAVTISDKKWTNIYCYRPPFAKVGQKLGLSLSLGEKPSNLADVVACAQNPLFIRLDCTLRRPGPDGFTEITFPLNNLPVLYEGETETGEVYNFEPESVGSDMSPIDSADGTTATLHLVCMTLPQSAHDPPNALFSHLSGCPADSAIHHQASFLDADKTHRARLPSLSQDKQDALVETEARLTWLFTEEIMHGLLRSGPITQQVIRYIEAQLMKKNPFVDFPTTTFIPLAFVKEQAKCRTMFFEQLEQHKNTPYRLVRVGDCFYASDNGTSVVEPEPDLFEESYEGLNISTAVSTPKSTQGNDEFCQGLGISILEPETPEDVDLQDEPVRPQLYWLLLIPQSTQVQIYFYSKMQQSVNRSEIIRVTKSMVNEVMERTNKLMLLKLLHNRRICSKYLLPPSEGDRYTFSSDDESEEEEDFSPNEGDNLVEILSTSGEEVTHTPPKKFLPGQFQCDMVYTRRFPLHWRLQPNAALSKLMSDVLRPFMVKNKPGMFVFAKDDAFVYCFLSEITTQLQSSSNLSDMDPSLLTADTDGLSTHPESPYIDMLGTSHTRMRHSSFMYSKTSPQGSITSERQSPRHSPSLTDSSPITKKSNRQWEKRELLLEVFGVEAYNWVIDGPVDLIESRLTSEITLKEVQQFLVRNPTTKLSQADIDFILPVEKEPMFQRTLCIPSLVGNHAHFLRILRKNILAGSLNSLNSNYLPRTLKRHQVLRYNEIEPLNESADWNCVHLCFYYNYLNRAPGTCLPIEQKVGEGVAGICLSVLNRQDVVLQSLHTNSCEPHVISLNQLNACLDSDLTALNNDLYKISIDIWSYSKMDVNNLYQHLFNCFRQTICDYVIETTISYVAMPSTQISNGFRKTVNLLTAVLDKASEWESSTVRHIARPLDLAPWYFDDVILQLCNDLMEMHGSLKPIISRGALSSELNSEKRCKNFKLYVPSTDPLTPQEDRSSPISTVSIENHRYLVLSGLPELYSKFTLSSPIYRRLSVETLESTKEDPNRAERRDDSSLHSRQESLASSLSRNLPAFFTKSRHATHQHCFLMFIMDSSFLSVYAYNCADGFTDQILGMTLKNIIQQETRHLGLQNILHQKMGLFHHTDKMSTILCHNDSIPHPTPSRLPMSPNVALGRLVQMDSSSSLPALESIDSRRSTKSSIMVPANVNFESLKQLIKGANTSKPRTDKRNDVSVYDIYNSVKLCTRPAKSNGVMDVVYTAVRAADANTVLRDAYADATTIYENWDHRDYLFRHGEPFLNVYLRRSQPLAAHEKAFKVYTKWAEKYCGPDHSSSPEEMMTVAELQLILKASRLLHFCRTPLIFSDTAAPETSNKGYEKLFHLVYKSEEMTAWYEQLASGFMREYASYLESIGMYLIVYGPSNDQKDEVEAYLSSFTITENYSVDSPVVYLLQVFRGGSIMCEVRLTDAFVSVTLYTLHRRYGRLQQTPYSHQKTEVGRANFQDFMEECDMFKQRIHVNSFVFDFHLRYIQRSLDDVERLPQNLNLLSIIKNTVSMYDRPAIYSRNRIIHGVYSFPYDDTIDGIIHWMLQFCKKIGYKSLCVDGEPVAFFVSSDTLSFDFESTSSDVPFRYTLLLCPDDPIPRVTPTEHRQGSFDMTGSQPTYKNINRLDENASGKLSLQYFIIATYRGMDRCTTSDRCQRAWSEVLKERPERFSNFLDEILAPGTLSMNDIFEAAQAKMDKIIEEVREEGIFKILLLS
jgi:hypothetical protein